MDMVYDVVTAGNMPMFLEGVTRMIELGYKLQGGIAVSDGDYYQAVVMDLKDSKNITDEKT